MKSCPRCNKSYNDTSLNFCLDDGTPLKDTGAEVETVVRRAATVNPGSNVAPYPKRKIFTYGKVAFWSGIISIPASFCYLIPGLPFAIIAVVIGHLGRRNAKQNPDEFGGLAKATTGFVIGVVITCLQVLFFGWLIFMTATGRLPDNRDVGKDHSNNAPTANSGNLPVSSPSPTPTPSPTPAADPTSLSSKENFEVGAQAFGRGDLALAKRHLAAVKKGSPEFTAAENALIEIERRELATAKSNLEKFKHLAQSMNDTYGMKNNMQQIRQLEAEIKRREKLLSTRVKRSQ